LMSVFEPTAKPRASWNRDLRSEEFARASSTSSHLADGGKD
jgi:hypothetical protein